LRFAFFAFFFFFAFFAFAMIFLLVDLRSGSARLVQSLPPLMEPPDDPERILPSSMLSASDIIPNQ
jgi:hypothetical protein